MTHPFKNYLICRDNYFANPEDVIKLSESDLFTYERSDYYPGKRTKNLLAFEDPFIKGFADWFAEGVGNHIFPGISMYELYLCFHINLPFSDPKYNKGWIHNDTGNLAGLIYLTPGEENLDTGTSIFEADGEISELPTDYAGLKEFYLNDNITQDYIKGFENNRKIFESRETIRIGNKFNRLIAYDSKMWHAPNSFATSINTPRLTLLFFVSQFNYL